MSYQSEKEEDRAFNSLSSKQREAYFRQYRESGGNVGNSLDAVLGPVWFDGDGAPRGEAAGQSVLIDTATGKPVYFKPKQ